MRIQEHLADALQRASFPLDSKSPRSREFTFASVPVDQAGTSSQLLAVTGTTIALSCFSDQPGVLVVSPDEPSSQNRFYLTPGTKLYVGAFSRLWISRPAIVPAVTNRTFRMIVADHPDQIQLGALPPFAAQGGADNVAAPGKIVLNVAQQILGAQVSRRRVFARNVSIAGEKVWIAYSATAAAHTDPGVVAELDPNETFEDAYTGAVYAFGSAATAIVLPFGTY